MQHRELRKRNKIQSEGTINVFFDEIFGIGNIGMTLDSGGPNIREDASGWT